METNFLQNTKAYGNLKLPSYGLKQKPNKTSSAFYATIFVMHFGHFANAKMNCFPTTVPADYPKKRKN